MTDGRLLWVLGDSWSDPLFDQTGAGNWAGLVAARLGVGLVNSAQGGAGWARWNYPSPAGFTFAAQALRYGQPAADAVVLFGSINDTAADSPVHGAPAAVGPYVTATLELVRRVAPGAELLVLGPQTPVALAAGDPLFTLAGAVSAACTAAGVPFVDALGWMQTRPDLIGADAHPTLAGHAHLAGLIGPLVAQLLAGPGPTAPGGAGFPLTFPLTFPPA